MGVDKRGDKLTNRRKVMGLDQHAHLRNHKVDWDKYYSDNEEESKKSLQYCLSKMYERNSNPD